MLCAFIKLKTWVMNYFSIAKNEESMVFKKEQVPFTPNIRNNSVFKGTVGNPRPKPAAMD